MAKKNYTKRKVTEKVTKNNQGTVPSRKAGATKKKGFNKTTGNSEAC